MGVNVQVESLDIADVKILTPKKIGDHRGFFSATWSRRACQDAGLNYNFVQDNHSLSAEVATVRGLHFQTPPFTQAKLVRCVRGSILDVVVDIRKGSPTFAQHVSVQLDANNWKQILVPRGFAHGFVTLEANTEVIYKVDNDYAPDHDRGILWCDPALGINWGIDADHAIVSDKDKKHPVLAAFDYPFVYEETPS